MPVPQPNRAVADRNLLFGILALQMDFIRRDALIAAMHAWVLEKAKPLAQILFDQGVLPADARAVLEALVAKHLELHGGDAEKSLAAVSAPSPVQQELRCLADGDLDACLAQLPMTPSAIYNSLATATPGPQRQGAVPDSSATCQRRVGGSFRGQRQRVETRSGAEGNPGAARG